MTVSSLRNAVLVVAALLAVVVRGAQAAPAAAPAIAAAPAASIAAASAASIAAASAAPAAAAPAPTAHDTLRDAPPARPGLFAAPVSRLEGVAVVGVNDLARLLGATKYWRADVRRLVLRAADGRRITLSVGDAWVVVDERTVRLPAPVVLRAGEVQVPVAIVEALAPRDGWPRLAYDRAARQLRVVPARGSVGAPVVTVDGGRTVVEVATDRADAAAVVGRSRARFRLRLSGVPVGVTPDSLPATALVRELRSSAAAGGVTYELVLAPEAAGWSLEHDPAAGRVRLSFATAPGGLERFATEGAPGPRRLRTVVVDPGHGGSDIGTAEGEAVEKALVLELARQVADELSRRADVRVVLTRTEDRDLEPAERVEAAHRARADAVVSLHLGAMSGGRARGVLVWCPPATHGGDAPGVPGLVELLPWRDAASARAVESRGLADAIVAEFERSGLGPAAVRERMPLALLGVQAPGVLIECGSLTEPEERARLTSPAGMRALAQAIAEGVLVWQRPE